VRWWVWVAGGVVVLVLVGRLAGLLPRGSPPGRVGPGQCLVPVDGGQRLVPGTVYRVTRAVLVPMPDETGAFTGSCLTLEPGWRVAVQRTPWAPDPWLPGALRVGELAAASGLPVLTARPVIWATSPVAERDFSGRLQSHLIRAAVLTVG